MKVGRATSMGVDSGIDHVLGAGGCHTMKVGRATSMGVDTGIDHMLGGGHVPCPGVSLSPGLESLHTKGASKVRFSVPSMEFVWETDPDGSKKVTFLVGVDGEPVVVVLGAGSGAGGSNNVEDVDQLLQEQARHQADQEADMIKEAAEEELDKLVRLSRSTVAAMEQEATKTQTSKVRDATREAVVQSLQEATMELERNILALEEVAPSRELPLQEATNTAVAAVNGSPHNIGDINRINGSPTNGSLKIVNGTTNGTMGVINGSMSNTTESSTDTNRQSHTFGSKCSESTASTASLSSLSTMSDPSTPSPSTSPPSPPAFTISSYGGRYSPPHKLHNPTIWSNEKLTGTNTISNNKPPITTPKPIITKTTTTVSSTTTLKTLNGTIVANKNANNITTSNGHNITHSVTNNQSSLSKTFNGNNLSSHPSSLHCDGSDSLSSNGSTNSSNSITPPSSLSSTVSMTSLPPSPPPSAPSSPTIVLEDCLKEEMEAMEKLEAIRGAAEAAEIHRMGVAAQIRRWEQFSEGSLEALKTATLERAKKRRQREILENLRHQVEVARRGQGHHDDTKQIPEKDDQAWQEQERKAKEAERRIREIARRAREEHRRAAHTSPNGGGVPHAHAINRNLNGLTHNDLFKNGINSIASFSTNGGDINGNIKTLIDDVSNNNSESSSSKNGRTCVRQRIRPPKPPSRAAIVSWFREEEIARGSGLDPSKSHVAPWFHGIISRVEAEEVLSGSAVGSFLVRVSERIWGYAISYRGVDRCRHYLIDVTNGKYTFFGSHNASHDTLSGLVEYHCTEPITSTGGELLTHPRAQVNPCRPDYLELFTGTQYLSL